MEMAGISKTLIYPWPVGAGHKAQFLSERGSGRGMPLRFNSRGILERSSNPRDPLKDKQQSQRAATRIQVSKISALSSH